MKKFLACFLSMAVLLQGSALYTYSVGEIRSGTGNDLNSGAFSPATTACTSPGTDYTQQDAPHVTFDGATITATTTGVTNVITLVGYTVLATDKCNSLRIAGGTNFTPGLYSIQQVDTVLNTWTLAQNVTTGAGAAMTGRMGGGILTLAQANLDTVNSTTGQALYWWKSGTDEVLTATITEQQHIALTIHGYQNTRGDDTGVRPRLTSATNGVILWTLLAAFNASSMTFNNVEFKHTAATRGLCIRGPAAAYGRGLTLINSVLDGCSVGIRGDGSNENGILLSLVNTEIKNCTSAGIINSTVTYIGPGSWIHDNAGDGYLDGAGYHFINGAAFDSNGGRGVYRNANNAVNASTVMNSVFYNNGSNGYEQTTANQGGGFTLLNNVFEANGAYGIRSNDGDPGPITLINNAFFNNASGQTNNIPPTATNVGAITLSVSPFTNAAAGVFTRNNTAGGGAALAAAGFAGASLIGTGLLDVGPLQGAGAAAAAAASSAYVQ